MIRDVAELRACGQVQRRVDELDVDVAAWRAGMRAAARRDGMRIRTFLVEPTDPPPDTDTPAETTGPGANVVYAVRTDLLVHPDALAAAINAMPAPASRRLIRSRLIRPQRRSSSCPTPGPAGPGIRAWTTRSHRDDRPRATVSPAGQRLRTGRKQGSVGWRRGENTVSPPAKDAIVVMTTDLHRPDDQHTVVHVAGEIDLTSTTELDRALAHARTLAPTIVVDLSAVRFCAAAGIRCLGHAIDAGPTRLICRAPSPVWRILDLLGLHRHWPVHHERPAAECPADPAHRRPTNTTQLSSAAHPGPGPLPVRV